MNTRPTSGDKSQADNSQPKVGSGGRAAPPPHIPSASPNPTREVGRSILRKVRNRLRAEPLPMLAHFW